MHVHQILLKKVDITLTCTYVAECCIAKSCLINYDYTVTLMFSINAGSPACIQFNLLEIYVVVTGIFFAAS